MPEHIRESGDRARHHLHRGEHPGTVTWIVEISSQILFSNTASVHYELLVGRDERSLEVGFAAIAGKGHGEPGQIHDFQQRAVADVGARLNLPKGVYSRAIELVMEDTTKLWDKPTLPKWADEKVNAMGDKDAPERRKKQKKIHLVVLTHGMHSNVGADMLYLKESIDATAKQARADARKRKAAQRKGDHSGSRQKADLKEKDSDSKDNHQPVAPANLAGGQEELEQDEDGEESDDEQVIVRGFSGNAVRTERGIQYLGKRLAKFVLTTTYPTQPYLPPSKSLAQKLTGSFSKSSSVSSHYAAPGTAGNASHGLLKSEDLPFVFTSISFIGHSLGGLVQMYAIAYIHKHSPEFFSRIKPVNYVAMASPLLGLSNENPLYVKFALDFGLVGRTGQDLGLTWRAPNIARTGWSAVISGFGGGNKDDQDKHPDPRAKPLLRILPTGPAHQVLKMFRNRTLYSNVVNDGIVPLRTSCLLFLDWRGLDKVENARREQGLISTVANFGWAELTGSNTVSHRPNTGRTQDDNDTPDESGDEKDSGPRAQVPLPSENATQDDDGANLENETEPEPHQFLGDHRQELGHRSQTDSPSPRQSLEKPTGFLHPINGIIDIFRPKSADSPKPPKISKKYSRSIQRGQTIKHDDDKTSSGDESTARHRPLASRGDSMEVDSHRVPPPKTSVFEAAGDLISPPLAPESWIIDPSKRARTIFHDRVYHPEDIPSPPTRRPRFGRSFSSSESLSGRSGTKSNSSNNNTDPLIDASGMKVEEKIARAYHRELSWRKVLVRLEPDAHNNMVVRRMFANAYGWDVIKHLCDTHFSDSAATCLPDSEESSHDRARPAHEPVGHDGKQTVEGHEAPPRDKNNGSGDEQPHQPQPPQQIRPVLSRTVSEKREASDSLTTLEGQASGIENLASNTTPGSLHSPSVTRRGTLLREDSALWTDAVFDDTEPDSEDEAGAETPGNPFEAFRRYWNGSAREDAAEARGEQREQQGGGMRGGGGRPGGMQSRRSLSHGHPSTPTSPTTSRPLPPHASPTNSKQRSPLPQRLDTHRTRPLVAEDLVVSPTSSSSSPTTFATRATADQRPPSPETYELFESTPLAGLGLQKPPAAKLAAGHEKAVMRSVSGDEERNSDDGESGVGKGRMRGESMSERVARLAGAAGP